MLLRLLRLISIVLSLLLSLSSCKSRQQALMGQVNSLIGKQLTFPEEMLFFNDAGHQGKTVFQDAGYKILIYLNPYACSACKVKEMRLWEEPWQRFIDRGIPTIILVDTDDIAEYKKEVDLQKVKPMFAYDIEGKFKDLNRLPENPNLHSYLLKGDSIVLVGNPYMNPRLFELFLKTTEP